VVRALGVDPIGSAVGGCSFLLIDRPLPWPRDIGDDVEMQPLHDAIGEAAAAGRRWRIQATAPDGRGQARVATYVLPVGRFRRFAAHEVLVAPGDAVRAAVDLVNADETYGSSTAASTEELLVCTHGRRDICCGSLGTSLWKDLVGPSDPLMTGTRVRRTSHTGGHRFAPTGLHLPSGTGWAWLDVDTAVHVARRDVPFGELADRYRGSLALATPDEQVVEKAVFTRIGWDWLDHERTSRVVERNDAGATVEIDFVAPDGTAGIARGTTQVAGRSPVPDCGVPLADAAKHQPIVVLDELTVTSGS
jgi:hypothetical protein